VYRLDVVSFGTGSGTLLGVDGGGSSTDLLLTDLAGNVIATGSTEGANVTSLTADEACGVLREGTHDLLRRGGSSVETVRAAVLGIAGVDREPQRSGVQRWLEGALPKSLRLVVTDVELVLVAGTADGVGMAVVSGTGSVVLTRAASGRTVKVGGRGPVEGDPGSGHAIGLAAMETGRFHAASESPRDIAALVPDIVAAADRGDIDAIKILRTAGRDLAEQAAEAVGRMGWGVTMVPCALGGGVVVHVETVREAFVARARALGLLLDPVTLVPQPVEGAIKLAVRLAAGATARTGATAVSTGDATRPARLRGATRSIERPPRKEARDR